MWEDAIRLFLVVLLVVLYGVLGYIAYLSWRIRKILNKIDEIIRKRLEEGGDEDDARRNNRKDLERKLEHN